MSSSENVLVWFGTEKSKEEQRQTSGSEIQPLSDVDSDDSAMADPWRVFEEHSSVRNGSRLTAHRCSSMNEGERFGIRTVGIGDWDGALGNDMERHGTSR